MCSETEEWLYDDGRAADRDAFVAKKKAIEVGQGGGGPSLSSPLSLASLPRLALSPPSLPLSFFLSLSAAPRPRSRRRRRSIGWRNSPAGPPPSPRCVVVALSMPLSNHLGPYLIPI